MAHGLAYLWDHRTGSAAKQQKAQAIEGNNRTSRLSMTLFIRNMSLAIAGCHSVIEPAVAL